MPKIAKEEKVIPVISEKVYSEFELQLFDKEVEKYRYDKTLDSGEVLHLINFMQYHKDQRSMTADGAVVVHHDGFGEVLPPVQYQVIGEKIDQWSNWKARKEFGEKKRLEGLGSLVESMKIK